MTHPTKPDLDALERLLEEATPGPWHLMMDEDGWLFAVAGGNESRFKSGCIARFDFPDRGNWTKETNNANAELIAAAPDLIARIRTLEGENEGLREALEMTALRWADLGDIIREHGSYDNAGFCDASANRARAALKEGTAQ